MFDSASIADFDPQIDAALKGEFDRQQNFLELIASENYVSPRVLQAQGSVLTNKYADGYPGARTYSGCEFVDVAEHLARERACRLFSAGYANVQPYSGSQANAAAYAALMSPGDRLLGMRAGDGGHITHGDSLSFAGGLYEVIQYGVSASTGEIDYDEVESLAIRHRPRTIVAGFSAYSRNVDWNRFRAVADQVGAYLLVDMAHVSGLVAAGLSPNPVPIADVTTSTTHKTLRGPRGGLILARSNDPKLAARLDAAVYPVNQGGPLMHVIAAKAIAFLEAMQPDFVDYQRQVLRNAEVLGTALAARGFSIASGGTDNHMLLVDLDSHGTDAHTLVHSLEAAHIAVNAIRLPGSTQKDEPTGIRMGTPAVTTRGLCEQQMTELAVLCADVMHAPESVETIDRAKLAVQSLCERFPVYGRPPAET